MLRSRGTLIWITGKKGVYFKVINAIYRHRWKGSILVGATESRLQHQEQTNLVRYGGMKRGVKAHLAEWALFLHFLYI